MKKRLTAILLVLVMLSTQAYAGYYPEADRPDLTFSEMLEYEVNFEAILEGLEKTEKLIDEKASTFKVFTALSEAIGGEGIDIITKTNLDYIRASIDNSEQNNAEYLENADYVLDIQQKYAGIIKKLYNSDYKEDLIFAMEVDEKEIVELIESIPTDEEYALQKELNELSESYYNNQFGTHIMTVDGKEYTFEDAFTSSFNMYSRYFKESGEILGSVYLDMVNTRNKLAKAAGFDNFADYAYDSYDKDYTKSDREAFYTYTKKYIVPLYEELYDTVYSVYEDSDDGQEVTLSDKQILETVRTTLEQIEPELTVAYDYMVSHELYDISASSKKKDGGFTVPLDYFQVPFLFINPYGTSYDTIASLVHEFGHFNANFHDPYVTDYNHQPEVYNSNIDISEVHSQGLEMLFMDRLGRIYGNDAPKKRYENLVTILKTIISSCLYSKWQEEVYDADNLTVEKINELYIDSCEDMGVEDMYLFSNSGGCEWIVVTHNFEVPLYYISYGVSAMTALEVFDEVCQDRAAGIDRYMKLTSKGSYVRFKDTLKDCGYSDIFSEDTFISVTESIREYTGLGYDDIDYKDWYYPYITKTANFVDSASDGKYSPSDSATRLMFVEALGRMQDDINGIPDEKAAFSDTDSKYVAWAASENIVSGIGDNLFGAGMPVTREQIICFLYRMAGSPAVSGTLKFADSNSVSSWAADAILWAQENGVADGYTDGTFRPKTNVTRGEAAKFLADAYEVYY